MSNNRGPLLLLGIALPILNFVLVMRMVHGIVPLVWTILIGVLLACVVCFLFIGAVLDDPSLEMVLPSIITLVLILILMPVIERASQRNHTVAQKAALRKATPPLKILQRS